MKKFVSVIALALLIPMAFAQEKKLKYVKSNVYENSVEMHYMRMLKAYGFEPSYSTIVRLTDDGKEVLFERMYDKCMYLFDRLYEFVLMLEHNLYRLAMM